MTDLNEIEKRILGRVQEDWPISKNPFKAIAYDTGTSEQTAISVIKSLKDRGIIRDISGIFNAETLNLASALIAMNIKEAYIDFAAGLINKHPGVSHNYLRDHRYNIWFTIVSESNDSLAKEAQDIAGRAECGDFLILKSERMYKIGVKFNLIDGMSNPGTKTAKSISSEAADLSPEEKKAVFILQADLPLTHEPFADLIFQIDPDMNQNHLFEMALSFKNRGIMRRYSAVLRHMKIGYSSNAMTVWLPGRLGLDETGFAISENHAVSHCYRRAVFPGRWEYPIFAMLHSKNDDELAEIIDELVKKTGPRDYLILRSIKEFKKERVRYFADSHWKILKGLA